MSVLLDSSVLIGIAVAEHDHHDAAERWLDSITESVATCPITQGAVVRHVVRYGRSADEAVRFLAAFADRADHEFWADDLSFVDLPSAGVVGHRQVTDAYLAELTRRHGGRLATFDRGLAGLHDDVAELVPTS